MERIDRRLVVGSLRVERLPHLGVGHSDGHDFARRCNQEIGDVAQFVGHFYIRHIAVVEEDELQVKSRLTDALGQRFDVGRPTVVFDTAEESGALELLVRRAVSLDAKGVALGFVGIVVPVREISPTNAMTADHERVVEGLSRIFRVVENLGDALGSRVGRSRVGFQQFALASVLLVDDFVEFRRACRLADEDESACFVQSFSPDDSGFDAVEILLENRVESIVRFRTRPRHINQYRLLIDGTGILRVAAAGKQHQTRQQ